MVCCRKSEIRWTRKSLSFRLAKRKVMRFLVLMESGLGSTLELSAFSTMVTWKRNQQIHESIEETVTTETKLLFVK